MPIHEYEPTTDSTCPTCLARFEYLHQRVDDEALTECPDCDSPCRQVLTAFRVGTSIKSILSPKNLDDHGFTQYTRKGKGYYEKTAGEGPAGIASGG